MYLYVPSYMCHVACNHGTCQLCLGCLPLSTCYIKLERKLRNPCTTLVHFRAKPRTRHKPHNEYKLSCVADWLPAGDPVAPKQLFPQFQACSMPSTPVRQSNAAGYSTLDHALSTEAGGCDDDDDVSICCGLQAYGISLCTIRQACVIQQPERDLKT